MDKVDRKWIISYVYDVPTRRKELRAFLDTRLWKITSITTVVIFSYIAVSVWLENYAQCRMREQRIEILNVLDDRWRSYVVIGNLNTPEQPWDRVKFVLAPNYGRHQELEKWVGRYEVVNHWAGDSRPKEVVRKIGVGVVGEDIVEIEGTVIQRIIPDGEGVLRTGMPQKKEQPEGFTFLRFGR